MKDFKPTKFLKVSVNKDDIHRGKPGDSQHCAVSCSLKRAYDTGTDSGTDHGTVVTSNVHVRINGFYYTTSRRLVKFIHQYDAYKDVEPTNFLLRRRT